MWRRVAPLCAFLLAACAARGPALRLPRSGLPLSESPPPEPQPPAAGPSDSASSRPVALAVRAGGQSVALAAPCRVGVWTTLQRIHAHDFVTRESWGRLGDRAPRMLLRVTDQSIDGVIARVRPEEDGSLSFVVEVAETERQANRNVAIYHGARVTLGQPVRRGYRFAGSVPPGFAGPVACWGDAVVIEAGEAAPDATAPRGTARFAALGERGFVAGARPAAETFVESWEPAEPFRFEADGIERMDFRLVRRRSAAGFRSSAQGMFEDYGPPFAITRDE